MTEPTTGPDSLISPDGRWRWDGATWEAVAETAVPESGPNSSSVFVHCPGCGVSEEHITGCVTVQFSNPALTKNTATTVLTSTNSEARGETCPSCQVTTHHRSYCTRANEPRSATLAKPSAQTKPAVADLTAPQQEAPATRLGPTVCKDGHTLVSAGGNTGTMYACSRCSEVRALSAWTNVRSVKATTAAGRSASKALTGERPAAKNEAAKGWAGLALIAVIIYGLVHACGGGLSTSKYGAQDRCETYIKTLLQAPSTAKFSGETATDNGDGTWSVTGSVDSENGFGAKLRSTWSCTAKDGGNNSWSIARGSVDG